ncbi:PIG-L deacetylase family protein [Dyella choica]|uniref:PIG-L family deacetylase n=1 Tax=Dyella choica TaxID=1927959 RepID=A0A3S0RN45_9GAMM|nr:PIG-L family deacetylase [Dyella choica]RUL79762.1 PIG-L family deacetylase [Dyella choica]
MRGWPVPAQSRLLVVAPHPDDETLGCGVLLQQVLAAGGEVRILLLTDGDNNPWPQRYLQRRLFIDDASRRAWGTRRREEVMHALGCLGVPAAALQPLGWRDMEVTHRLRDDAAGTVESIRAAAEAFRPSLVAVPALRDSHPDHGAAHVLCRLAMIGMEPEPKLLAYPVHGAAQEPGCPISLEATAEQRQRKLAALAEHRTQMALSGRRILRLADGPERYIRVEGGAEEGRLPWRPPTLLRPWLRLLVATSSGVRDWPWPEAPVARDARGTWRLERPEAGQAFVKLHLDWRSPWIFDRWGWWEA